MEVIEEVKTGSVIVDREPEFKAKVKNNVSATYFILCENGNEVKNNKGIFEYEICGINLLNWVARACESQPVVLRVNPGDDIISLIRPYAKDSDYSVVLYANTPLVTKNHLKDLIEYVSIKRLNVVKLKKGFIFNNEHIKTADEIFSVDTYDFSSNDFFEVKNLDDLSFAQNEIYERLLSFHRKNAVEFVNSKLVYVDASVEIGYGTKLYPNVTVSGNSTILDECSIGTSTTISNSKIGANVKLGSNTIVVDSIIKDGVTIDDGCVIKDSVISNNVIVGACTKVICSSVKANSVVDAGSTLDNARIAENVRLGRNVRVLGSVTPAVVLSGAQIKDNVDILAKNVSENQIVDNSAILNKLESINQEATEDKLSVDKVKFKEPEDNLSEEFNQRLGFEDEGYDDEQFEMQEFEDNFDETETLNQTGINIVDETENNDVGNFGLECQPDENVEECLNGIQSRPENTFVEDEPLDEPVAELEDEPLEEPEDEPVDEPDYEPLDEPEEDIEDEPLDEIKEDESLDEPEEEFEGEPDYEPLEEPIEDEPVDEPEDEPVQDDLDDGTTIKETENYDVNETFEDDAFKEEPYQSYEAQNYEAQNYEAENYEAENYEAENYEAENYEAENYETQSYEDQIKDETSDFSKEEGDLHYWDSYEGKSHFEEENRQAEQEYKPHYWQDEEPITNRQETENLSEAENLNDEEVSDENWDNDGSSQDEIFDSDLDNNYSSYVKPLYWQDEDDKD